MIMTCFTWNHMTSICLGHTFVILFFSFSTIFTLTPRLLVKVLNNVLQK